MENRREFLKKAAVLSGGAGVWGALPESIQRAFAIDPDPHTTYLDAEHVVFLMQENRSFDHCFGTLQGVRGFNDPRAVTLPDGNKVWAQSDSAGNTFAPFRLDLRESRVTWLGSLPHGWADMTAARHEGWHDRWLDAKRSGHRDCAGMPLTLGHFDRRDLPFYHALADAFTVCDHHFCSSLTGTTPNRLHFLTGTIRARRDAQAQACVHNSDVDYAHEQSWKTFPEVLGEHGVTWKVYQNELSVASGLSAEEEEWLANFTDNPLEWFTQFRVRHAPGHRAFLPQQLARAEAEAAQTRAQVETLPETDPQRAEWLKKLERVERTLERLRAEVATFTEENFNALPANERERHERAFCDNRADPHYRQLESVTYRDGGAERTMNVPKGDILHQFRADVRNGTLPAVSWLVAPAAFSDHPGSPWYGAWYVSEVLDILTSNPDVWRKTIFVLNYDENDGWFDHMPPFVPPDPARPDSGKASAGIDTAVEHVNWQQEWIAGAERRQRTTPQGPIGLGFRVPMVVASPWSRGGWVNSQVFDLTSPIQFLEHLFSHKTGKKIVCENVTSFRRAVCGDMTSIFRPWRGEKVTLPTPVERRTHLEAIHRAQFKDLPSGFHPLSADEVAALNGGGAAAHRLMPRQEEGTRPANALPYELSVDGHVVGGAFRMRLSCRRETFGPRAAGAPFAVRTPGPDAPPRNYAVLPGDSLEDEWKLPPEGRYHLTVHGPNGFFREFAGSAADPALRVRCEGERTADGAGLTGNLSLTLENDSADALEVVVTDKSYEADAVRLTLGPRSRTVRVIPLGRRAGWHDVGVTVEGLAGYEQRFAGHVETGRPSITDPLMGGAV